jgi:hypothetical protein
MDIIEEISVMRSTFAAGEEEDSLPGMDVLDNILVMGSTFAADEAEDFFPSRS